MLDRTGLKFNRINNHLPVEAVPPLFVVDHLTGFHRQSSTDSRGTQVLFVPPEYTAVIASVFHIGRQIARILSIFRAGIKALPTAVITFASG